MCRNESGIMTEEDPLRQCFSVAVHPSRQLILFSDGYVVTAVELLSSSGTGSCLLLMKRLVTASEQTLDHKPTPTRSSRSSLFRTLRRKGIAKRHKLHAVVNNASDTGCRYQFETTPDNPNGTVLDQESPDFGRIDRGRILFGEADNVLDAGEHVRRAVSSTDADQGVGMATKALMLSWGLAATHSRTWTAEHDTVADAVASGFVKLFAVILEEGETAEEAGGAARLRRVLDLYCRVIGVASMDSVGQNLRTVQVTLVRRLTELFLRFRSTGVKGLHTLHGVALAVRFAEQHYSRTYSTATSPPRLNVPRYLDQVSTTADAFMIPSVFAADRLDWVTLKENQPLSASVHSRLAADCCY